MNTTIYFVRHGAYAQQGELLPLRTPGVHLSLQGRSQAEKLAAFFADKQIAAFYASPLERAQETAKIIAGTKPVITDERLNEIRSDPMPDADSGWDKYTKDWYIARGGETMEDVGARMRDFIQEKSKQYAGQSIVVASHGDPIMIAMADYAHKKPWEVPFVHMATVHPLTISAA